MSDYSNVRFKDNAMPPPHHAIGYKKIIIAIIILFALAVAALGVLLYFSNRQPGDTGPKTLSREEITKHQIEELNRLREASALGPTTEKEQKKQIEELNKLRKQSQAKPSS